MSSVPSFFRQLITALSPKTLRRVHKDRRARAQLLWVLLGLAAVVYEVVVVAFSIRQNGALGIFPLAVCALLIAAVVVYRRRRPVQTSGPVTLDLSPRPEIPAVPDVRASPDLLREFAERALLHAILGHRAASEGFLKHKGVPEGQTIITRQTHLRLLREYALLDRLGPTERDLILAPDGAWEEGTIDRASLLLEPVRVFRWLLLLDAHLPLVGEAALIDFPLAASLIEHPEPLFASDGVVEMEHIRSARSAAEQMFFRCYSEGQSRGFYIAADAERAEAAIFEAQRLAGREDEDALIGNIIVSRASDDEVRLAAQAALTRMQLLRWVQERLYGMADAEPQITAFH